MILWGENRPKGPVIREWKSTSSNNQGNFRTSFISMGKEITNVQPPLAISCHFLMEHYLLIFHTWKISMSLIHKRLFVHLSACWQDCTNTTKSEKMQSVHIV